MSEPFVAEIRLFPYDRVPRGWVRCEGQVLPISANMALFSLIGTTYGGDGMTTFKLPDLQGRVPVHASGNVPYGRMQGEEAHTLTVNEMPKHTHVVSGSTAAAEEVSPQNNAWGAVANFYGPDLSLTMMNSGTISTAGGSQPHGNMQPYLVVSYCIALQGIFPPRN